MKTSIPCKDCLILPICKSKKFVKCGLLHNWWIQLHKSVKWACVNEYLPNAISVLHESPSIERYNIHKSGTSGEKGKIDDSM